MSDLERSLLFYIRACKLPRPELQYRIVPDRKFRWDMAWPAQRVAVEVQGGIWTGGKHTRGVGLMRDMEKNNLAVLNGWVVLFVSADHIESGSATDWIRDALELRAAV